MGQVRLALLDFTVQKEFAISLEVLARTLHEFSTAATNSSDLHVFRDPQAGVLNLLPSVRLRWPTRKRVPPRIAERRQVGIFVALLQEPQQNPD